MTKEKTPLMQWQKEEIWRAISSHTLSDDRDPQKVIVEDYDGNEERYLRAMKRWHNVKI